MKHFILAFTFALFVASLAPGQSSSVVRREVLRELTSLKPRNTKDKTFTVKIPRAERRLPKDLKLDIVYKDGHYSFKYVVLRFELTAGRPQVNVTRFTYGSALDFWKEFAKGGDTFTADSIQIPAVDFARLLRKAVTYFDSNIAETDVVHRVRRRDGVWVFSGRGSSSITMSSGEGSISFKLGDPTLTNTILEGSGSLVGDIRERASNGYDYIMPNLFWNVFDKYFSKSNSFIPLSDSDAESLAISRLEEANLFNSYRDYYRQAAYVEFLGAKGTAIAIPTLEKVRTKNGLESDWDKYLAQDASAAISKIRSRSPAPGTINSSATRL